MCGAALAAGPDFDWPAQLGGAARRSTALDQPADPTSLAWRWPDQGDGIGEPCDGLVVGWGIVYATSRRGAVQAIDQYTGQPLWREDLGQPLAGPPILWGTELLVGTTPGLVYVLDARRGGALARHDLSCELLSTPARAGTTVFVCARDSDGPCVAAFEVRAGVAESKWRTRGGPGRPFERMRAPAAAAGDTVVVGDMGGAVTALEAGTGEVRWQAMMDGGSPIYGAPTIAQDRAFAANRDGRCSCFELRSGRRAGWVATRVEAPVYSSLTVAGSLAYLTTHSGFVYEFDVRTGGEFAETEVPRCSGWNSALTTGVATRSRLFFGSGSGHVYSYHRQAKWAIMMTKVDSPVFAPPAVSDGAVYVVTQRGIVHALREWRTVDERQ